ncbi:hypothetical protein KW792_01725 [Candidatus Saccharibacteria bacterium]|nr:hypothetical protein [Candidatus Saccharibacteria bacterium]
MNQLKPTDKTVEVKDVVITCMDHRFQEPIVRFLKDEHEVDINHADRLAIGGSSKGVIDGTLMPSLKIAYEKHRAEKVWLFDHTDCGGFGGLEAFDRDEEKEIKAHNDSLAKATEAINKKLPELVVITFVVPLDGKVINAMADSPE